MKKLLLFLAFVLAISTTHAAGPLSGIKIIDQAGAGNYLTMNAAIADLLANGIDGPVDFKIRTGVSPYTMSATNITTFLGHGLFSVTFESESGSSTDVLIENSVADSYLLHLYGADSIQFKNLSLRTNSSSSSNIFMLDYDADNIRIENCSLIGNYNGSFDSQFSLIFVDDFIASDNTNCDNLIVRNCMLDGGKVAITVNGNSSGAGNIRNQGIIIENNNITNQKQNAIKLDYCSTFSIKNNFIKPTAIVSPTSMFGGISLTYCDANFLVENNQVYINNANPVGNLYGVYIEFSNNGTLTNATNYGTLKNNMIHLNGGSPGSDAIGVFVQDCNYTKLYHNTIRSTADGSEDYCAKFNSSTNIEFKNNLLQVGSIPLLINKDGATTMVSNYNVFFGFNGIGTADNGSTFLNTPSAWTLATGLDANSIFKQVTFYNDYSTLNLSASAINDAAIRVPLLANVTTDIHGTTRQTSTIAGAFERYGTMSGVYYIDNNTSFPPAARTFKSYTNAALALASGISAPVTLEAKNNGFSYEEQFLISHIPGSSSTNTVVFTKQATSSNPSLKFGSTNSGNNFIVHLDSVVYLSFLNTNFSNTPAPSSNLGKVFNLVNWCRSITIDHCNLFGNFDPGNSLNYEAALIYSSFTGAQQPNQNLFITNSSLYYGSSAIVNIGKPNFFCSDTYIANNNFNSQLNSAIVLKNNFSPVIVNNSISTNSTSIPANFDYTAIKCDTCEALVNISANQINFSNSPKSNGNYGIVVSGITSYTTAATRGIISNNMILGDNDVSYEFDGISLQSTGYKNVYHNTVISKAAGSVFFASNISDTINVMNNIFRVNHTSAPIFINLLSDTTYCKKFDYNNIYTNGATIASIGGVAKATLTDLRNAMPGRNINSNIDTVVFNNSVSIPYNLHLAEPSLSNSNLKAIALSSVMQDIDGDLRNATTPFMGADEGCQSGLTTPPTAASPVTICAGLPTITATKHYGGNLLWYSNATGGPVFTNPPIGGATGTITIYVSEKLGYCETTRTPIIVNIVDGAIINGTISVNSVAVTNGTVFLFKQNIADNRMDTLDTQTLSSANYSFTDLPAGNYLVGFKPNAVSNPNTPSTFNGNQNSWTNASLIVATCANTFTNNINATSLSALSGPGTISGKIQEGTGFGKIDAIGDPIPGVDISLEQNPGGIMVAQTQSDANGLYSFTNLPLDDYRIRVSIPGTEHDAYYDVTIDSDEPVVSNLVYVVDSNSIYPLSVKNMQNTTSENNSILVIPNPFSNEAVLVLPNELENEAITLTITDITGKTVNETKLQNKSKVTLKRNNLENGLYFVKIQSETKIVTQKIIIIN
ncbi:MAG: carboxypeptidase regulatory-like domain-containing protein [Bacteroidota bacterium]